MQKYDFHKMQIEYMQSEYGAVEEYLRSKGIKMNGFIRDKIVGWRETKENIQKQAVEESKKKIQESMVITNDELRQMKKTAFSLVKARLNQLIKKSKNEEELPTKEFTDIIKTLKVELLEPTVINKVEGMQNDGIQIVVNDKIGDLLSQK